MVRIVNSLLRRLLRRSVTAGAEHSAQAAQAQPAEDADFWVNARGKKIGSKRSRTKRLERRKARDVREVHAAMKAAKRTARF